MGIKDFLKQLLGKEVSLERKILNDLKSKSGYDLGKIWEDQTLKDLKKLDSLLLLLIQILKKEGVPITKISKQELLRHLYDLVNDKNSLLRRSSDTQIEEIQRLGPEKWFEEFNFQINHLKKSLLKD